jgi:hypothetical protein
MRPTNPSQLFALRPTALLPSRLEWLCQPEQIEHTLVLLFRLKSWTRASQRLLYDDRQGLHDVQALILAHALQRGKLQATAYLDRSEQFPRELLLASAADDAAQGLLIHLNALCDPEIWPPFRPEGDRLYQRYIRPLVRRLTGQDFPLVADAVKALEASHLRDFLHQRLQRLVAQAKRTRRPIPIRSLSRLCLAPVDVLPIRDNRLYFLDSYDSWKDLERSDLCKLDPEGFSEIALAYRSPSAEFVFHLPFRQIAPFVPAEHLRALQATPGVSQEHGIVRGRAIDEAEGLAISAHAILQDLGVEIASVCPHGLVDKQVYLAQPAIRDLLWPTAGGHQEDWLEDVWDGLCLPPSER